MNGKANRLYYGDNLDILRRHVKDETVDLCYIDPPFNSRRTYNQIYNNIGSDDLAQAQAFIDTWQWDDQARVGFHEIASNARGYFTVQTIELLKGLRHVLKESSLLAYLVSMTRRIAEIHRVLKPTGTFYLHCDPTSSHYLKVVCDGIFCGQRGDFLNEIIWQRTSAHANVIAKFAAVHDVILRYSKSDKWTWNQEHAPYEPEYIETFFDTADDEGRRYSRRDLTAAMSRASKGQIYTWRGITPPPSRCWAMTKARMDELEATGRIHWPLKNGGMPRLKLYPEDLPGVPVKDIWTDIRIMHNLSTERLGYPTQKPEALMARIIGASSNEGDTVLDPFCGCGTTVAVAQRLKRRWIGMDITYQSIALVLRRLEDHFGEAVASAIVLDGVPCDMASAQALAHKKDDRLRKEFEKWAVLTFTRNRAVINQKKGADAGIDGYAYVFTSKTDTDRIVFQVKSGNVGRGDVAKLKGDMDREKAVVGILLTLEEPTEPMRLEAKKAGLYAHSFTGSTYDRVQIVTIREIIEERKRLEMPLSAETLKAALAVNDAEQVAFALEPPAGLLPLTPCRRESRTVSQDDGPPRMAGRLSGTARDEATRYPLDLLTCARGAALKPAPRADSTILLRVNRGREQKAKMP